MGNYDPHGKIDDEIVDCVLNEVDRADVKHGIFSLLNVEMPTLSKLAALVEETGEVGRALTYDEGSRRRLIVELTQVASVAVSWLQALRNDPATIDTDKES